MLALHELQTAFVAAMVYAEDADVADHVRADGIPVAARLAIYRNNIFHNLREALRDVYPVVERLVGSDFFNTAGDCYIRAHASPSGDIHDFGAFFGDFLSDFEPARTLPYLADTARLEWLLHQAFHAAGQAPPSLATLAAVPPDRYGSLRFVLHQSCRLFASRYPVLRIWQANQPDAPADATVDLAEGGVRLLVHRNEFTLCVEPLTAGEYALLHAFAGGAVVSRALMEASVCEPEFDLAAFLQRLLAIGALADWLLA